MIAAVILLLAGGAGGPPPRTHTVEIRGMEFHPAELTVAVGDTIVWVNHDIVPHTATSTGSRHWDIGQLAPGQAGRYVMREPGKVSYNCTLHPTMKATLIIRKE